jgi:acetolactate synthase-1/2/3 large subunit
MKLTGGQIVVEYLIRQGVPYVAAIPGHGCLGLVDALFKQRRKIKLIQCKQEVSCAHLADGYYRAARKPLAVITSIGPGAINTAIGAATAYVDSTPMMIITGSTHTYMRGKGVLQEIERARDSDFARMFDPVVKRWWRLDTVDQVPGTMHRAFNLMMSGRRGPVLIDMPMDVQCDAVECTIPGPEDHIPTGLMAGDANAIAEAARMLAGAKRPVILAGGGVAASGAEKVLLETAEALGAAVITTLQGKGCFPEDHPLYAWHAGSKGTTCGNYLASHADVILAVGVRFADETASSYRHGISFAIPPTRLIHVDIDPAEIGKNYPVEAGITGDARAVLEALVDELKPHLKGRNYMRMPYFAEILRQKEKWMSRVHRLQKSRRVPVTISCALKEIRDFLRPDAFVVTGSGNSQAQILQEFPFFTPGTLITTGGFSTMGFSMPAAMGVKLACPDRQVAAIVGDGDFMMTMQEMHTASQFGLDILIIVINNQGWISIKDLQMSAFGQDRGFGTDFMDRNGKIYSPDFKACAQAFGLRAERVDKAEDIKPALARVSGDENSEDTETRRGHRGTGGPALVEIIVNREYPHSGSPAVGWWDVPVPDYLKDRRAKYLREKKQERLG